MRLSEAIRLGSMLKPQGFAHYQTNGGSCAFGAAMDACGVEASLQNGMLDTALEAMFPLSVVQAKCPACETFPWGDAASVIIHLNDDHEWSREAIADWVESVESPETPPAIERTPDEEFAWVQTSNAARAD